MDPGLVHICAVKVNICLGSRVQPSTHRVPTPSRTAGAIKIQACVAPAGAIPATVSLVQSLALAPCAVELTAKRTLPFYDRAIAGDLRLGKNVLVVAHGNSNRSIVMQLDGLSHEQVLELNLDTGVPLIYDIADDGSVRGKQILQ